MTLMQYRRALTIAGSDSGGGAGIQADLKTFAALGCYGMSVVTAVTAQNTHSVTAIHTVPAEIVSAQVDAVFSDIGVDAVKIGMLGGSDVIEAVAAALQRWCPAHTVVDPVMVSKSGDRLLRDDAIGSLRTRLLPLATVITPNLSEAEALLDQSITTREGMERAAGDLLALGGAAVVIKGGHLASAAESPDCVAFRQPGGGAIRVEWLESARVSTSNTHGTGCTFSSAIAAHLATGLPILEAVRQAKHYLASALAAGATYTTGRGHGPVHHFWALWPATTSNPAPRATASQDQECPPS